MFLKKIVYLLIVTINVTVTAMPNGSPVCTVGSAAPQSPHTVYTPNVFGTIDLRGFQVKIGNVVLSSSAANTIAANTDLTLEVSSSTGTQFKGVLVILNQPNVNLASSLTIDPASTTIKLQADCAPAGYGGFTHQNRNLKSSVTATVNLPSSLSAFLDVNIVVNNNSTAGSAYFYTRFTIMTAAAVPIPVPTVPVPVTPTVPVLVSPPVPVPVTPPVPVPVTPPLSVPVKAPVPIAIAPVPIPITPSVPVPVTAMAPVPVPVAIPVKAPVPIVVAPIPIASAPLPIASAPVPIASIPASAPVPSASAPVPIASAPVPIASVPIQTPTKESCGLFGFSIICLNGRGVFGRLLRLIGSWFS